MEDDKIKIVKHRCEICGRTIKQIASKNGDEQSIFRNNFTKYIDEEGKEHKICWKCESKYRITSDYCGRGYGYAGNCRPKMTRADKHKTPTYGLEMEVAGNIFNVDKIYKLARDEMTIGYDTSVEGAQFELSYCPGTYYWYKYESKLAAVCALLKKDKWVKHESATTGMHIHIGNIDKGKLMSGIIYESITNPFFWQIITIFGERRLNEYCRPILLSGHHDAISWSTKWKTIEFRIFKMTYDFEKILQRIKFIRQIIDNTNENGIEWWKFKEESKLYFFEILKSYRGATKEIKEKIKEIFETQQERTITVGEAANIENLKIRLTQYIEREKENHYWMEEEEENEEEEEENVEW